MKKSNVAGLIVIALFVIGIAVALMQYKREQTYSDEQKNVLASEKVVLSADENLFGMTTTDAPENYDITKDYYENYDNAGLKKYVIPIAFMDEESYIFGIRETKYCQYVYIDDSQDIVVEMTKEQREKWISKLKEKIDDTYTFVDNCLNVDLLKIIKKHEFDEAKNPHLLVPNYLKNTEAEEKLNDKRD